MKVLVKRDFLAGAACLLLAFFVLWQGQEYALGSLQNMGPGYMPRMLGVGLVVCGVIIMAGSLRSSEALPRLNLRAFLFVTLAILSFALLMNRIGLFLATILLVFICSLSERRPRLIISVPLSLGLCLISYAVFIVGLNMPIRLFPWSF